jgi:hypothetical protein
LDKPDRSVLLRQLPQSFREGSVIDQMKSQLFKQALYLLQAMRTALCLKTRKRRSQKKVKSEEEEDDDDDDDDDEYDLDFDKLSKKDMVKIKRLFERLQEQELQLEQQEEYLIGKIEELKALNEEHEKLKHSHTSLIDKHKNLEKEYACATNVSSCVDPLQKENVNLKTQLEVLNSKHVKM